MIIYQRETLKGLLEVRHEVLDARSGFGFAEIISYKDWGRETEIRFKIVQHGNPVKAQLDWRIMGFTPWAWRYIPLTDESLPYFQFVLNRAAGITIKVKPKYGEEFEIQESRELKKRHFSNYYSKKDFCLSKDDWDRWHSKGGIYREYTKYNDCVYPIKYCIPKFSIRRPQFKFLPVTSRPDRFFELTTEAKLYFPRHRRTPTGEVKTEPIKFAKKSAIKKQVKRHGTPYHGNRVDPFGNEHNLGSEYIIVSHSNGHSIQSIDGEYYFNIVPDKINKPTAYNFEFTSIPRTKEIFYLGRPNLEYKYDEIRLYIHHNDNVKIEQTVEESLLIDVQVFALEELTTQISYLREKLPNKKRFKDITKNDKSAARLLLAVATIAIAFIPVYGWIASLALTTGELVSIYYTEHDFLGEKVSPTEFAVMGVFGILGSTFDIFQGIRIAGKSISYTDDIDLALRSAFDQVALEYSVAAKGSIEAIETVGKHPLSKLIASLDTNLQAKLNQLINTSKSTPEFLTEFAKIVNKQLQFLAKENPESYRLIGVSLLEEILTPDGKNFENLFLRDAYQIFLKRAKKHRDPLVWMHTQNSMYVKAYLRVAMGDNYREVIKDLLRVGKEQKITMATAENIKETFDFYDEIVGKGLEFYYVLDNIRREDRWKGIRGLLRDCYQFEHPLELRFARNLDGKTLGKNIDLNPEGINVQREFLAFIVPRTRRHTTLLADAGKITADSALLYTQHPKTRNIAWLIRNGAEHLFTPQQIADAVCTELLRVNFHKLGKNLEEANKLMDLLENDFKTLTCLINTARGTKYKVPVLIRTLDDIDPALKLGAEGWPSIKKNPKTKVFKIENEAEVKKAIREREKWAEKRRRESQ